MPTENRSSNTENAPCPFCGGQVDPEGWLRGDGMRGPECESCGATAPNLALWNGAQPAQQHQGVPVLSQCPMCCQAHEQKPVGRVGGQQADSCDVDFTTWRCGGCGGSWTGDPDVTAEVERLRADIKELRESMAYRSSLVGRLEQELYTLRAQLTERDAHPLRALGQEAYSTLVGMVEHCLNMRTCMGMDEGFKSFDSEEEHDFVKELRSFVALSASAEPSAPVERDDAPLIDALRTCEKWFVKHSPTAPLIGGFGDAEHPMLTCIRAALERKPQVKS